MCKSTEVVLLLLLYVESLSQCALQCEDKNYIKTHMYVIDKCIDTVFTVLTSHTISYTYTLTKRSFSYSRLPFYFNHV